MGTEQLSIQQQGHLPGELEYIPAVNVSLQLTAEDISTAAKIEAAVFPLVERMQAKPPAGLGAQHAAAAIGSFADGLRPPGSSLGVQQQDDRWKKLGLFRGRGIVFSIPPLEDDLLLVMATVTHLRDTLGCKLPIEIFVGSFRGALDSSWEPPVWWRLQRSLLASAAGVKLRVIGTERSRLLKTSNKFLWKLLVREAAA